MAINFNSFFFNYIYAQDFNETAYACEENCTCAPGLCFINTSALDAFGVDGVCLPKGKDQLQVGL